MSANEADTLLDVEQLPDPLRDRIRDMLIEGATFEDIVETVNAGKGPTVTQMMVESYFRRNLEVQKGRVRRQIERAEEIKKSIGNPETAEGQLASAAFLTGFMRLTRKSSEIDLQDAEAARMRRENLGLERQVLHLRKQKQEKDIEYMKAHIRHEWAKLKVLRDKLRQMQATFDKLRRGDKLDTATLAKIREIYGIISEPFIPPELQAENPEPPAA
jgi:DNA gyrase/topoisomerase IV subunit A